MIQTRTIDRDAWLAQRANFRSATALEHFDRGLVRCFVEDGSVQLLPPPGLYEPTALAYRERCAVADTTRRIDPYADAIVRSVVAPSTAPECAPSAVEELTDVGEDLDIQTAERALGGTRSARAPIAPRLRAARTPSDAVLEEIEALATPKSADAIDLDALMPSRKAVA